MKSGIYKITCTPTGKFYIGSANNIAYRKQQHFWQLRNNKHHSITLQRSFNKYKEENFRFEIIERCIEISLLEREQYYIDILKPHFNICQVAGKTTGYKRTQESIEATSLKNKGRKRSEEQKERLSKGQLLVKDKKSQSMKLTTNTLEFKEGLSNRALKMWQSSDYRKKVIDACKKSYTEEKRKEQSIRIQKRFENPDEIEKHSKILKEKFADKNIIKKISDGVKGACTKEIIDRRNESLKQSWNQRKENGIKYKRSIIAYQNDIEIKRYKTTNACVQDLSIGYNRLMRYIKNVKPLNGIIYKYEIDNRTTSRVISRCEIRS